MGWQAVSSIRHYLGTSLARNLTLLNRERIVAPVQRELALSLRLAKSELVRQWLLDEGNAAKKTLAFREAESFRRDFTDRSYFLISALSNNYYFNDDKSAFDDSPRYRLVPNLDKDQWFFTTIAETELFNVNVDIDVSLKLTKIWLNVIVEDNGRKIGLVGSGLDLTDFLRRFVDQAEPGITPIILDGKGAIQAHPDYSLIAYNSATKEAAAEHSVFGLLERPQDADLARDALADAAGHPGGVRLFEAEFHGKPHIVAVSYIPELHWHVLTAVDLAVAELVDLSLLIPAMFAAAALLISVGFGFSFAVNRLVFRPLAKLTLSARAMAAGNYSVALPPSSGDEIGALTDAFASMVAKVQGHTEELEETVKSRTHDLVLANRKMALAHKQIHDSIAYASLIQRAILPERSLAAAFGDEHFVLWRPRDVVGGDFYIFCQQDGRYLLGVADCAGHGVAGACMTMLGHAAIELAIAEAGMDDPAGILARTDQALRAMLGSGHHPHGVATHMEAGLVYVDQAAGQAVFAGAKIALYWNCGEEVGSIKGARRALAERRPGQFANEAVPLRNDTVFYLTTDGLLDQSGGDKGFGFGTTRFTEWVQQQAGRRVTEQQRWFESSLAEWQGENPQRDDITLLCVRFAEPN
ncbi:biofilm regulation protein phosphatase SiaA [Methylogaea oryzae]|uniref:biofilm regulation protein phosphatase SiaA n=1 Tax=Methylogaea oryzae TaxID=1295382 RepID=UPI0020D1F0B3|nr:biofilm regulation protein phosphatase SiaA [Methylogaea oryzae]